MSFIIYFFNCAEQIYVVLNRYMLRTVIKQLIINVAFIIAFSSSIQLSGTRMEILAKEPV